MNHQLIELSYRGGYDWQYTLDFYRLRSIKGLESIDDNSYQRYVSIDDTQAWFKVVFGTKPNKVLLEFELEDVSQLKKLVVQVRRMFDLDVDIEFVEQHLEAIQPGVVIRSGIRMPGVWSAWEAGVRAILGQQVSIKAAINQLNLLVSTLQGENVSHFPTPQELVNTDLSFLKMPQSRKETLRRFAQLIASEPEADFAQWLALKGIGPWTINYAALRGLSEPDRFLEGDLVVKKARQHFTQLTAQNVSPFGSYATFHLWSHAG